jgi:biotin carboxyl carrier protein
MYHATVNGKKKLDVEWNGKSALGLLDGKEFAADIAAITSGKTHWIYQNKSYNVELVDMNNETKELAVKVNGTKYTIQLKDRFDDLLKSLGMEGAGTVRLKDLKAPMPGLVLDIMVSEGTQVEKDTPLIILEAMKMENVIKCPAPGIVKKVHAMKGNAVEKNAVLIEFQ